MKFWATKIDKLNRQPNWTNGHFISFADITRCNYTAVNYDWSAGKSFAGLFEAVFNETVAGRSYAFGVSDLAISMDRLDIAHLINNFNDYNFIITIPEADLTESASFLSLLISIATMETWAAFVAIFIVYALLMAQCTVSGIFTTASICRLWGSAFELFAVSIGQGKVYRDGILTTYCC